LDYIKLGLFKIIYKLDLPKIIKIYLILYIIILKLVYKNLKLLIYKVNIYKNYKKNLLIIKILIIKYGLKYYKKAIKKLYKN